MSNSSYILLRDIFLEYGKFVKTVIYRYLKSAIFENDCWRNTIMVIIISSLS